MRIEIDQSGKVENTSRHTVLAFSNKEFGSLMILASEKRKIQKLFREAGKGRVFVYRLFAVLIFLLIKKLLPRLEEIAIDVEYAGQESLVKNFLLAEIRKLKPNYDKEKIVFRNIGKKSRAHFIAYGVAIGRRSADKLVGEREVLKFLLK